MDLARWAQVGELLSGVGIIAALFIACYELRRWRHERQEEKRLDIAAEMLVTLHAACDACHDWAVLVCDEAGSAVANPETSQRETYLRLYQAFKRGRGEAEGALREVRVAETHALTHLPNEESEPLRTILAKARQIDLAFREAMIALRQGSQKREQVLPSLQESLTQLARSFDDVREQGSASFSRITHLESTPPTPPRAQAAA